MFNLSEDLYLDFKQDYKNLVANKELPQEFSGNWERDMKEFLRNKLLEKNLLKQETIQKETKKEEPKVVWNLNKQSENQESNSKEQE